MCLVGAGAGGCAARLLPRSAVAFSVACFWGLPVALVLQSVGACPNPGVAPDSLGSVVGTVVAGGGFAALAAGGWRCTRPETSRVAEHGKTGVRRVRAGRGERRGARASRLT